VATVWADPSYGTGTEKFFRILLQTALADSKAAVSTDIREGLCLPTEVTDPSSYLFRYSSLLRLHSHR